MMCGVTGEHQRLSESSSSAGGHLLPMVSAPAMFRCLNTVAHSLTGTMIMEEKHGVGSHSLPHTCNNNAAY
ncbi:hypothetical protein CHARACLAT_000315 [Characodon lateralis]|uniref:Uncharacterized protein n=1 Tax=Characodon lateralis TaxID=208331 RepID=A0ABU7EF65_9TELE|nr:hypothetical protein [Characodon lateralis]